MGINYLTCILMQWTTEFLIFESFIYVEQQKKHIKITFNKVTTFLRRTSI